VTPAVTISPLVGFAAWGERFPVGGFADASRRRA
jgi:hypothetical protein